MTRHILAGFVGKLDDGECGGVTSSDYVGADRVWWRLSAVLQGCRLTVICLFVGKKMNIDKVVGRL